MPSYHGTLTLDKHEVEVVVGLEPDRLQLISGGRQIGEWGSDECAISHLGEGVYVITAEDESLRFVPREPVEFDAGINHGTGYGLSPAPATEGEDHRGRHVRDHQPQTRAEPATAPPPRASTLILFYLLVVVTTLLGAWALLRLI